MSALPPSRPGRRRRLAAASGVVLGGLVVSLVGAAGTAPAHAAAAPQRVTTQTVQISANVAFNMPAAKQRADIAAAMGSSDVVGWQEINKPAQQAAIRSQQGWGTYWPGGFRNGAPSRASDNINPISYDLSKWQRVGVGKRWTSPAFRDVSRERWVSWVILKDRRTGVKVARWNVHFVPGAFAKRGSKPQREQRAALQQAWHRQVRIVSQLITELEAQAHVVVGGGDINRVRHPFLGDQVAYDCDMRRLDYMTHVKNRHVLRSAWSYVGMNSDHAAVRATYDLVRWRPRS